MRSPAIPVLVVDDDRVTRDLLREVLEKEGYAVHLASSGEEALEKLKRNDFPIVLSDIRMLEVSGMDVLKRVKLLKHQPAVILMTGFGSMEGAVEAIQEGAFDYISKPFKMSDLKSLVGRAAKHWEALRSSGSEQTPKMEVSSKGLIGKSPKMVEVYKTLARAAMSASSVLIIGESGTGKELAARAIHDNSPRQKRKFVAINCGALSESLLESELFGHVKGAFTGAVADKKGLLDEASSGTLFLDEIGDIPPALQVKLLRVLQEGEFRAVGSTETRRADVRVIAATHRNLEAMVKAGSFREDLYYRLKVIEINLPPLRERIDDLPELVGYFLARYAGKNQKTVSHVSEEAMDLLSAYSWPGNIRELENVIERAVAMSNTPVIFTEDLPPEISRKSQALSAESVSQASSGESSAEAGGGGNTSLEEVEKAHILKVLQDVGFNKSKASEVLGIDRATLYRKAQRYGIDLKGK